MIEALRIVQRHRGWVSDQSVAAIARLLGTSTAAVDSVATFYNLIFRKPVGRHVVMYCDSVSCYVMGCDKLRVALEQKLGVAPGETTPDGRFTLLPIVCLGACDHAPAMMIDEDLILDVAPQNARRRLREVHVTTQPLTERIAAAGGGVGRSRRVRSARAVTPPRARR